MVNLKFDDYTLQKYIWVGDFHEGLAAVQGENGLYGFINKDGKEIIPCEFFAASNFSEGLSAVQGENGFWGYINKKGELIIPYQYQYAHSFKEGKAGVACDFNYKYIDKENTLQGHRIYKYVSDYQEGYAIVTLQYDQKYNYYLDIDGYLSKAYEFATLFYNGIAFVADSDNIYTINESFEIIKQIPRGGLSIHSYSEGIIKVEDNCRKYGYLDSNLNQISPIMYQEASDFSEGLAVVKLSKEIIGFIDQEGKTIAFSQEYQYSQINDFLEGMAAVQHPNGLWGFINKEGKEVIPCQYQEVSDFSEDLAWVLDNDDNFYYIDKTGTKKISIVTKYHSILELDEQVIHFEAESKQALQAEKIRVLGYVKNEVLEKVANDIDQLVYTETSGLYIEGKTRLKKPQQTQT